MNICIVTPEIVGPVNNGGIGTHCFFLAQMLQREGHQVTVLYTGPFENHDADYFKNWFFGLSTSFVALRDTPKQTAPITGEEWFVEHSYRVYLYLRAQQFDVIHFQDWQGNGFHTLQAKRTTGEFRDTPLIVTMHSSTEWIKEAMRQWLCSPIGEAKLQWCERYCCQYADLLVSPSAHMFAWTASRGWTLAANRRIAQYCIDRNSIEPVGHFNPSRLAFFGRLEERKGLVVFCEALRLLSIEARGKIDQVDFIGKLGETSRGAAEPYIAETMTALGIGWDIHSGLDTFQARKLIKQTGSVAFMPSLLDNLPFTIIECCCDGIPVFGSDTGGIPELLPPGQLFAPTIKGVTDAINRVLTFETLTFASLFDPERSRRAWLELSITDTYGTICTKDAPVAPSSLVQSANQPLVSVCIPYFNYGDYLPRLLASIRTSTYSNYEVIVIDDGSTQEDARVVFDRLSESPSYESCRFFRKPNGGAGETRNYAAAHAKGELLLFIDADNLATPSMIERFVHGMHLSGADCLCCHFKAFTADSHPTESSIPQFLYMPIGPALEVGWADNVFGDTNFIIKADIFNRLGGFDSDRTSCWNDWEFLARLVLRGYKHEVIPAALFWYRLTPDSLSRNSCLYLDRRLVLRTFAAHHPPQMRWLFESVLPSYFNQKLANGSMQEITGQSNLLLAQLIHEIAMPGSKILKAQLSGLWYRQQNLDVAIANIDPYEHWLSHGMAEGRLPAVDLVNLAQKLIYEREQSLLAEIEERKHMLREVLQDSLEREKVLYERLMQMG